MRIGSWTWRCWEIGVEDIWKLDKNSWWMNLEKCIYFILFFCGCLSMNQQFLLAVWQDACAVRVCACAGKPKALRLDATASSWLVKLKLSPAWFGMLHLGAKTRSNRKKATVNSKNYLHILEVFAQEMVGFADLFICWFICFDWTISVPSEFWRRIPPALASKHSVDIFFSFENLHQVQIGLQSVTSSFQTEAIDGSVIQPRVGCKHDWLVLDAAAIACFGPGGLVAGLWRFANEC